ncbi:MAG TPA: FkbM family methyltransferase [Hyphomicrobiales bacterium]|nr:FkbM family methyltransferase [Hyphomicrobiales bacterium]
MIKELVRGAIAKAGYDVFQRRSGYSLVSFIENHGIDVVIDVGANRGQFARRLISQGYKGRVVSFEPIAELAHALAAGRGSAIDWQIHPFALGDVEGEFAFNISRSDDFSSFKEHTAESAGAFSGIAVDSRRTVPVRRLDNVDLGLSADSRVFLKLDTQGYDRSVLDGATATLRFVRGMQIELPIHRLYQDTWSFAEAITHLDKIGFVPSQFWPVGTFPGDPASAIEMDCVLRRKEAAPLSLQ